MRIPKPVRKGKVGDMVDYICHEFGLDRGLVRAKLVVQFPELKEKESCANCGASMVEYFFSVSILDAQLLTAMGRAVERRLHLGSSFTEANKVHVQTEIKNYTLASRMTIASKLGLVTKVLKKNDEGKMVHDQKAGWLITKRGFSFLRGERIPKCVKVFRNEIQEHMGETCTIHEIYATDPKTLSDIAALSGVLSAGYANPRLL